MQLFIEIINRRSQVIAARQIVTPADYYNQSNAFQGLILLLNRFTLNYVKLVKKLKKVENKKKQKESYKHLISSHYQNLMLQTRLQELYQLMRNLRELQQQALTHNGQFDNQLEDTLDNPVFILGEGLEASMPFDEPRISRFMRSPCRNPLSNTMRISGNLEGNFRHITLCPSWETDEPETVIEGPCSYFTRHFLERTSGKISYLPVMLSAMIDFTTSDNTMHIKPFVQTIIETALNQSFRQVALHAPIGCAYMLYALGFRTKDSEEVHPTLAEQEYYVVKADTTTFPISYNTNEPMISIDCIDERFINVTSLRVFYLDLGILADTPVYLINRNEPTTWMKLLYDQRYLALTNRWNILPEFNYLPYTQFTPSYSALRNREITGRMPLARVKYESDVPDATNINDEKSLETIGAIQATLEDQGLVDAEKLVRAFHI